MKKQTAQIRSFNRFYTKHIGLLESSFLDSEYSLTDVRILFEIGNNDQITSQQISNALNVDKGYLSRILRSLIAKGLVIKFQSINDKRNFNLKLSESGEILLQSLDSRSDNLVEQLIKNLNGTEKELLINSMNNIKTLLEPDYNKSSLADRVTFREELKPGDIGYLIHLHGKLYAEESGYSLDFENYVIKTFYEFLQHYSPEKDRIWLAEYNGKIEGCIAIIGQSNNEAQLRWFLITPLLRGTGIGKKLFTSAIEYCRNRKYDNLFLMTTNKQGKAISMYEKAGFVKTESIKSLQWGQEMVEERFDLKLS
ncbi:bifunctional helix-turn-helix transcriptional regulator/GNAT family N-acetyltransferase [Chryseobacterium pennipullorum]|uniref:GNAT family N-acetyltransferase n=1 Tax=Chryseobacterium pennipullorum TaxID=2258963 RepID=A0A3D9B1J3_9FLAO|nr:bifunctional helix-turn-helix transcriptional regulator/GNAT family N-acetyltransferase [Chryseobacterium pennipullorum]REC47530.1 GNAT family N-acetyltransferase [Chryseobacterium pennipullorum]